MDWKNKKILVVGMGKSGVAAAEVLKGLGSEVTVCDRKRKEELGEAYNRLMAAGVKVLAGEYPEVKRGLYDLVIASPGVPLEISPFTQAVNEKIPIWSEIELAYRFNGSKLIAVTGTNGKTTTTSLIGHMLDDAGIPATVAGNIGKPMVKEVFNSRDKVLVVEVSSFQLETIHRFKPDVAVFLNITPDHLDRHKDFENYKRAKMKIFKNQSNSDKAILNYNDPVVGEIARKVKSQVIFFSTSEKLERGIYIDNDWVVANLEGIKEEICPVKQIKLKGLHNLENSLAAVSAGLAMGIRKESIAYTLSTFPGVEHRLEHVATIKGVSFVNDSKGTNPEASMKALDAYADKRIILLAGGMDKGSDFTEFASHINKRVAHLIIFGETALKIREAVEKIGFKNYYKVTSLYEAVEKAWHLSKPGDVVLLSPACASWDMFSSYEERGDLFKKYVLSLGG